MTVDLLFKAQIFVLNSKEKWVSPMGHLEEALRATY
jgi:hypothetical protein